MVHCATLAFRNSAEPGNKRSSLLVFKIVCYLTSDAELSELSRFRVGSDEALEDGRDWRGTAGFPDSGGSETKFEWARFVFPELLLLKRKTIIKAHIHWWHLDILSTDI